MQNKYKLSLFTIFIYSIYMYVQYLDKCGGIRQEGVVVRVK